MKSLHIAFRVLLALIIFMPILGVLNIFPAPTADMYNSAEAFSFIEALYVSKYVMYIMAAVFAISLILTIMNRMAAVALLILPITVNIVAFHAFLDGGIFTAGAIMGNVLMLLNAYFLWQNKLRYAALFEKSS